MRLSAAFGILTQTVLLSSPSAGGVWARQEFQPNSVRKSSTRFPQGRLREIARKSALKNNVQSSSSQLSSPTSPSRVVGNGNKQKRRSHLLQGNRRTAQVLKNSPNFREHLNGQKKCNADVGILSCGLGEYCMAGYCINPNTPDRMPGMGQMETQENVADHFCNPESPSFYEEFVDFFDCNCDDVDLGTGLGTLTCSYPDYCMDDEYNYCADINLTIEFTESDSYSYEYCYDFKKPEEHLYCIGGDSDKSQCSIHINKEKCDVCIVANDEHCPYGDDYFFSYFDCTNLKGYPGNAGNGCNGDYASNIVAKAAGAIAAGYGYGETETGYVHPFLQFCSNPSYFNDQFGQDFVQCDCQNVDLEVGVGQFSCHSNMYTSGPYSVDVSLDVNIAGHDYFYDICYNFVEPRPHIYCLSGSSESLNDCGISIDGEECLLCVAPERGNCLIGEENTDIGIFNCIAAGTTAGNGCHGDFASDVMKGFREYVPPIIVSTTDTYRNLVMDLFGVDKMNERSIEAWAETTKEFAREYYEKMGLMAVNVEIEVRSVVAAKGKDKKGKNRALEDMDTVEGVDKRELKKDDFVTVVYDQTISYSMEVTPKDSDEEALALDVDLDELPEVSEEDGSGRDMSALPSMPFSDAGSREAYIALLNNIDGLEEITGTTGTLGVVVSDVDVDNSEDPEEPGVLEVPKPDAKKEGKGDEKKGKDKKGKEKRRLKNQNTFRRQRHANRGVRGQ